VGGHDPKWSSSSHVTCGCSSGQASPEKSQWVGTTPSDLQVFVSLVGMRAPKLDPEKSQLKVISTRVLQAEFTSDISSSSSAYTSKSNSTIGK